MASVKSGRWKSIWLAVGLAIDVLWVGGPGIYAGGWFFWLLTKIWPHFFVPPTTIDELSEAEILKLPSLFGYPIGSLGPMFFMPLGFLVFSWIALLIKSNAKATGSLTKNQLGILKGLGAYIGALTALYIGVWLRLPFASFEVPPHFNHFYFLLMAGLGSVGGFRLIRLRTGSCFQRFESEN